MKLTCYVTSTSPWFLYAASVSLCFFFFASNSRVTVASPPSCPATCGVDRPCSVLLHYHYVRALPFNAKYGKKPSGRTRTSAKFLDVTALSRAEKFTEASEWNTAIVPRLQSKCHPATSFPSAGLASKSDRDNSELKHFANRKKKFLY